VRQLKARRQSLYETAEQQERSFSASDSLLMMMGCMMSSKRFKQMKSEPERVRSARVAFKELVRFES
jgi:hypothetical protein